MDFMFSPVKNTNLSRISPINFAIKSNRKLKKDNKKRRLLKRHYYIKKLF